MLLKDNPFGFLYAPSGSSADAGDEKDGISDDEVAAVDAGEGAADDEFGAGLEVEEGAEAEETVEDDTPPSLADVWKQHKIDGLPDDPQELQRQIGEMRRQASEAQRYRDYTSLLMQQIAEQNKQRQPPAQSPAKPKAPWSIPQFDRRLIDQITTDENGNLIPKPGARPDVVDQYRTYTAQRDAALDQFLADPVAVVQPLMQEYVSTQAAQIAQQHIQAYQQYAELKAFENENRGWAFEKDGRTLSRAGETWNVYYRQALQLGLPDPIAYAEAQFDAQAYRAKVMEEASREDNTEDAEKAKRLALLKKNTRQPQRNGQGAKGPKKTPPSKNPFAKLGRQLEDLPKTDFDEK